MIEQFGLQAIPQAKTDTDDLRWYGPRSDSLRNVQHFPDHRFLCFDLKAPDLPNLVRVDDRDYRPVDFMAVCGAIISKPGYSTFSESCRLDLPIISIIREGFAEAPILLEGLQDYADHQIIRPEALFDENWAFLHQPLNPPRLSEKLAKNGNETIAQAVVDFFEGNVVGG
ncbi:MAG: hypothetical protein HC805_07215 [Alkalinema sp. RL_2_19]|nr:hypothetical protein [Alkalinema sp. RL_2_19]